ncbi:MAG: class I SAM-dependent methyltransferase [Burkholderiales bacterium]|nr:MAG: class I SAM-dependent methyltransferase [Burkholderiales bacterium]
MTGFDADWLRLREPLDAAARSEALATRFAAALRARPRPAGQGAGAAAGTGPLRILDLAAGTGANLRVLATSLDGDQAWTLLDLDPALLGAQSVELADWARRRGWTCAPCADGGLAIGVGSATVRAQGRALDLQQALETLDAGAFDAVVTTAFLDLVSEAWLERLCAWLVSARLPLLATLTVDGRRDWFPPLPEDPRVDRAFRLHQAGDKGFGASLGIGAAAHLATRLTALGHQVSTARADWRIDGGRRVLLQRLIDEAAGAASEAEPEGRAAFQAWAAMRTAHAADGRLVLEVGHLDLLALPPG